MSILSTEDDVKCSQTAVVDKIDHFSVIDELERQFRIGNVVPGIEEAYLMYAEYGSCAGFGVRRGRQLLFKGTTDIRHKEFYCSCRGFFANSKDPLEVTRTYSRQHIRTGCGALLRIKCAFGERVWVVSKFVKTHNHEMLSPDSTYLLRSVRNLTSHKKSVLDALRSAGIGVAQSFRFTEMQSRGVQNVGFTKIDAFNYADSYKEFTRVLNGDARALIKFCIDKSNSEQLFYSNVKLDSERRLMHIFFRDSRSLTVYEAFGDVLVVDTTYRTNKYDIVVAPFIGVNHHCQNILFGVGFLSSESTPDFNWLFSIFLESMNGRQPQVIFTDQCQAMIAAIDHVFPDVCHRLCHWHRSRNAPSHFGSLNQNKDFQRMWRWCMKGVESEDEFEELWSHMCKKYVLEDVPWFTSMYKLKRRWASVFTQDYFTCGMIATSRSKATNRSLKRNCATTQSLFEFVQCYERMKTEWRNRESASDVSNMGNPGRCATSNPILRSASRILTHAAYMLLERQMINVLNYDIVSETVVVGECVLKLKVMLDESDDDHRDDSDDDSGVGSSEDTKKHENVPHKFEDSRKPMVGNKLVDEEATTTFPYFSRRLRTVHFDSITNMARCSCKLWETMGIVCRHILKVYNAKQVKVLPNCYLMPRWSKDAKLTLLQACRQSSSGEKLDGLERLAYMNCFMRMANDIVADCQYVPICRIVSLSKMKDLHGQMISLMDKHRCSNGDGERHFNETDTLNANEIRDPPPSERRPKQSHSKKPFKCHLGSPKKVRKKKCTSTESMHDDSLVKLQTGASVIASHFRSSFPANSVACLNELRTNWSPVHHSAEGAMGTGGIPATQQSSVNDQSYIFCGIADVWK